MSVENPKEQEQIDNGLRIETFVKDPEVQRAIARLASENYADFKAATSVDDIRMAHAKGVVLDSFIDALQGIVDVGEGARRQRADRERREAEKNKNKLS